MLFDVAGAAKRCNSKARVPLPLCQGGAHHPPPSSCPKEGAKLQMRLTFFCDIIIVADRTLQKRQAADNGSGGGGQGVGIIWMSVWVSMMYVYVYVYA